LAEVNPNIQLVSEYNGQGEPAVFECRIDGHRWKVPPSSVTLKCKKRTGCPACKWYYWNGNVYHSSWELLFHQENPHLERNEHRFLPYVCEGKLRKWYPDFYDPETGQYYEIKPIGVQKQFGYRAFVRTEAKRAAGHNVIWINDHDIAAIREKHPDFKAEHYRSAHYAGE